MPRLRTLLPLAAAAAVLFALIMVSQHPSRLVYAVPILAGVAIMASGALAITGLRQRTKIAPGALPGLLVASMSFADFFVEDNTLRIGIAAVTAVLFFILVRHLHEAIRTREFHDAVIALSEWSAVMIVFSLAAGLYAAVTFLTFPLWGATLIFAGISAFVSLTLARLMPNVPVFLMGAAALLLAEGFYFLAALPLSYWVNGAVLAAVAYALFMFARDLATVRVRRTLMTAGAVGAAVLITARWR
jgi:hypothetical protein